MKVAFVIGMLFALVSAFMVMWTMSLGFDLYTGVAAILWGANMIAWWMIGMSYLEEKKSSRSSQ